MVVWLFFVLTVTEVVNASLFDTYDCLPRSYGLDSVVCVCNSDYCDSYNILPPLDGQYVIVSTSKDGERFNSQRGIIQKIPDGQRQDEDVDIPGSSFVRIVINKQKKYQVIVGFGCAMTDTSGFLIRSLPSRAQTKLLQSCFSPNGNGYNLMRVPMGCTDFSPRSYTYDDVPGDTNLSHFQLASEDFMYKIPIMKAAAKIRGSPLMLMTVPWIIPSWMTQFNALGSYYSLKEEHYQTLANYFLKFFDAYDNEGFHFAWTSIQDEPLMGGPFLKYTGTEAANFTKVLGNALVNAGRFIEIHIGEVTFSSELVDYVDTILDDPKASVYVSGVGLHGYDDNLTDFNYMDSIRNRIGFRWLLETEFSTGVREHPPVLLGGWRHATYYIINMIQTFNHGSMGYIDWNLAVDLQGGPSFYKNYLDAAIIVNTTAGEFYKQPIFYVMGHFSKFVPPGSRRIDLDIFTVDKNSEVLVVAFETLLQEIIVIIYNPYTEPRVLKIEDQGVATITVPSESISTVLYRNRFVL